jgi:hypothetical protein
MLNSVKHKSGMMVSAAASTPNRMSYAIQAFPRPETLAEVACLSSRISVVSHDSLKVLRGLAFLPVPEIIILCLHDYQM